IVRAWAEVGQCTGSPLRRGWPARRHQVAVGRCPPEVGFVDAVSNDKGCYLGQEPPSRIHNRGQVNRVMVRVRLSAAPTSDGPLALSVGEREAGELSSWSSALDGLAIVRRSQLKPEAVLEAGDLTVTIVGG